MEFALCMTHMPAQSIQARDLWTTLKNTANSWLDDRAMTQSAAVAYYTVFSIAPLLLISVSIGEIFFGKEASRNEIFSSLSGLLGAEGAKAVESMVEASSVEGSGVIGVIVGVTILLIGATTVFGQVQDSLNLIWKVEAIP
ncbi:MAG: hypothetical protein EOP09_15670, partial [Proteobacteria bacterium]